MYARGLFAVACGAFACAILSSHVAAAQVTDVQVVPGAERVVVSFVASAAGVGHDVFLASESGVGSENFSQFTGGRSILNVQSPLTIRGLENNRNTYIVVVERDADGGELAAAEVVTAPRGTWVLVEDTAQFLDVSSNPVTDGVIIAAGNAPTGCQAMPKPVGCDIYRSTDGGATWTVATSVITVEFNPRAVEIHGLIGLAASQNFMVGDSIYRSDDAGITWTQVVVGANLALPNKTFAFDPVEPSNIYGGNFDFGKGLASHIVKSIDSGLSWAHVPEVLAPGVLNSKTIAVDPSSSLIVWLGGGGVPPLARTTDGGGLWEPFAVAGIVSIEDVVFDSVVPTKLWIADPTNVYTSVTAGAVFSPSAVGFAPGTQVRALSRDSAAEILFVATSTGVYESRDDGATFVLIGEALDEPVNDLVLSSEPAALIAATAAGLFRLDMSLQMADAGPDAGSGGGGDGCACSSSGRGSGPGLMLLAIFALLAVRGLGVRAEHS